MPDTIDDNNQNSPKVESVPGHGTGHSADKLQNSLFHDLQASDFKHRHRMPDPTSDAIKADARDGGDNQSLGPSPETFGVDSKTEKYKFDLYTRVEKSVNGKTHTSGEVVVERTRKKRSGDAHRKARSRENRAKDGWRRFEMEIRKDVADPLRVIANALNKASLRGDPFNEELISLARDRGFCQ